jgi:NADPH2:quinone reductase
MTMRAISVNEYGAAPALTDVPDPRPQQGQVLIKVEAAGINPMAGRFLPGDQVFGQLLITPLGSAGTYAERVAVTQDAPLARLPKGLEPTIAAALPTAGGTALEIVESVEPLTGKTVLMVGAAGGVGSFATQLAANAGAQVIAVAPAGADDRMRGYGAAETIDRAKISVTDAVQRMHPDGVDVLIDVASDGDDFAALAALVRPGGTALTTRYVADPEALASRRVTAVNFQLSMSSGLLERLAGAVVDGGIVAPPITRVELDEVPGLYANAHAADGKTVIVL